MAGGFFAVYIPAQLEDVPQAYPGMILKDGGYERPLPPALDYDYALKVALMASAEFFKLEAVSQGAFKIVRTVNELEHCLSQGIMAAIYHFEGAEAIDKDLNNLYVFYQAGLRSLGIVWSRPTIFGHGVPFSFPRTPDTGDGLTEAGKALVKACNELGIMLDLSHLNEKGFWDVERLSDAPLVATHSGAYSCSPSPRNLLDSQLDAIKATHGVVGVNFHIGFLREDGRADQETSLKEIVRHLSYMADRMGIDHVALGSDFDGATMPHDLKDAAGLPKLIAALAEAGFDQMALEKIAYKNWLRVLGQTWKSA
ncbi:MAG: dipeptidase [Deinococcales bacterium]